MSVSQYVQARELVKKHGETAILEMARRGERDPSSLSAEEIQAVSAYVWLKQMAKRN